MITVIHPSRSRSELAAKTIDKWISRAGTQVEYIMSVDINDPDLDSYKLLSDHSDISLCIADNSNAVQAVNEAAKFATGDILVVASDDFDCPIDWAFEIMKATHGKEDFVLKTFDGAQKWIVTLPIMDRIYYERYGYIYNPIFQHLFCDTELTHIAELTGKLIIRNDIEFTHHHELTSNSKNPDEVTKKANATWSEGERIYLNRVRENFGIAGVNARKCSHLPHQNWLNNKLR